MLVKNKLDPPTTIVFDVQERHGVMEEMHYNLLYV